ncbi:MAG TPA: hypothetical protein VLW47_02295 [Thermodesulfobacteriota bacterium]|nr:hypothetical protein [Thermodesulfobacteriota bacterium]
MLEASDNRSRLTFSTLCTIEAEGMTSGIARRAVYRNPGFVKEYFPRRTKHLIIVPTCRLFYFCLIVQPLFG